MASRFSSFLAELKRRNVYRVAAVYLAVGAAISLGVPDLFGAFGLSDSAAQFVILLIAIGFPVALVLAWAYEVRPEEARTAGQEESEAVPISFAGTPGGRSAVTSAVEATTEDEERKSIAEVNRVNSRTYRNANQTPTVKLMPLPARAQFLNVIESVFSGLSMAIIHNSNYRSVEDAKAAIDSYFPERNSFFQQHPRKAGNKIWGEEQVPSYFSVSHNCKNPRFMSLGSIR